MVSPNPSKNDILNRPVKPNAKLRPDRQRRRHSQLSNAFTLQFETLESRHLLAATIENFPGLNSTLNPPDTVGDVGPKHYVQMVNSTQYQIWNKTGTALTGPLTLGNLWPVGNICRSNLGDPIVVYDHLADRWLLTQFANPSHMCMAVSQTSNPVAGTWFTYTFDTGNVLPDYPKIGVWPNGYYMSTFEDPNLGVYAFNRTAMLAGGAATFVKTTIPALGTPTVRSTRILPADLDGAAPPIGTPNYFVRTVDSQQDPAVPVDRIEVFAATPNFVAGTLAFPKVATLAPNPFEIMTCNRNGQGLRDCIPQPGIVDTLDALSNRPMMQLRYRNFGTHQSMVFNQTIDVEPLIVGFNAVREVAGIRWYELRKASPAANWTIFQQGNHLPQAATITAENQLLHRWMGSSAMDGAGNIATAYNITNSNSIAPVFAGARYAARLSTAPLGTLGAERLIRSGVNAQGDADPIVEPQRWGDYSSLSVDPLDDSTFWFTTHYAGVGGVGAKPTSITSFLVNPSPTITLGSTGESIVLRKVAAEPTKIEVLVGGSVTNVYVLADLTRLTINSGAGSDILTVDFINGNPIPAGGLAFNGQTGVGDRLRVLGGAFSTITKNFTNTSSGNVVLATLGSNSTISYTGLEPVLLNVGSVANMIFNLPPGPNLGVQLGNDLAFLLNTSEIRGTTFEDTSFTNPTNSLTVNLGNSGDSITMLTMDPGFPVATTTTINGGNGNDIIVGNNLNNTLRGNGGNDQLTGGGGNDLVSGGTGNDTYFFDTDFALGTDTLGELAGVDTLDFSSTTTRPVSINLANAGLQPVNAGLSLILGSAFAFENVIGGNLGDNINGNTLANTLTGGGGNDLISGGTGDDIYLFDTDLALGADILSDAGGIDTLDFRATTTRSINLNLGLPAAQIVNAGLTLTVANIVAEIVLGGAQGDVLTSSFSNSVLVGGRGNDRLIGGAGRNVLIGGSGADDLLGFNGDDLLIAGFTVHDSNINALKTILGEWAGANLYGVRVANLRAGVAGIRLQAAGVGATVFNDPPSVDKLTGGLNNDWFFANPLDVVVDKAILEFLDVI
jgi:Ca2+-binding RTX toxin-like protein